MIGFLLYVASLALSLLRARVVVSVWAWFVAPLGIPAVGFWQAWGLFILVGLFRVSIRSPSEMKESDDDRHERCFAAVVNGTVNALTAWGLAYFAHWVSA